MKRTKKPNPVHKYREKFNKPKTHRDRKKAVKSGYCKHKEEVLIDE